MHVGSNILLIKDKLELVTVEWWHELIAQEQEMVLITHIGFTALMREKEEGEAEKLALIMSWM